MQVIALTKHQEAACWLLLGLGVWLVFHPYNGLIHDSLLYTVQALHALGFDYSRDLFFLHGSQQNFTVFPFIHAVFIDWLGIGRGTAMLYWMGMLGWFLALWLLLTRLGLSAAFRVVTVVLIALANPHYDNEWRFGVAESFVTSRLFAEMLSLLGLALWLGRQRWVAVLVVISAVVLHPLNGIWVVAVIAALACGLRITLVLALLTCLAALVMTLFAPVVVDSLQTVPVFSVMDPEWLSQVQERSPWLFPGEWGINGVFGLAMFLLLAVWGGKVGNDRYTSLSRATIIIASCAFTVFYLMGSWAQPLSLLIQVQMWRLLWLLIVIALIGVALLTARYWREPETPWVLVVIVAATWLGEVPGFLLVGLLIFLREHPGWLSAPLTRSLFIALVIFSMVVLLMQMKGSFLHSGAAVLLDTYTVFMRGVGVLLLLLLLARSFGFGVRRQLLLPVATATALGAALVFHDGRSDARQEFENSIPLDDRAAREAGIASGETIYWLGGSESRSELIYSWLWLKRPYYFSDYQMAGIVFNQETSTEADNRKRRLLEGGLLAANESNGAAHIEDWPNVKLADFCYENIDVVLANVQGVIDGEVVDLFGRSISLYDCGQVKL